MPQSETKVPTGMARRYMGQLCKHFEHRVPVTLADTTGRITFEMGVCDLAVEGDALLMRCAADDEERLARVQDVVARHFVRFAFRDAPTVTWQPLA